LTSLESATEKSVPEALLAQDGLPASETNPQFHQQMVYAVAMATIYRFEEAFGRRVFWSDHVVPGTYDERFVRRFRSSDISELLAPTTLDERSLILGGDHGARSQGFEHLFDALTRA